MGLAQVSDESAIAAACDKLFGFFVGAVMKAMGGKANPKVINDLLRAKLSG